MILKTYSFNEGIFYVYDRENLVENLDHTFWIDKQGIKYELLALISEGSISFEEGCINIPINLIYSSLNKIPDIEDDNKQKRVP